MTVKELKALLNSFDDDTIVVTLDKVLHMTSHIEYTPVGFGGHGSCYVSGDGKLTNVEFIDDGEEFEILVLE